MYLAVCYRTSMLEQYRGRMRQIECGAGWQMAMNNLIVARVFLPTNQLKAIDGGIWCNCQYCNHLGNGVYSLPREEFTFLILYYGRTSVQK